MGKGARLKKQRREIRRELQRQAKDPKQQQAVENLVKELRFEAYYVIARLVDDGLSELYGFGDTRKARLWAYVKARAIWDPYMERGLPINEAAEQSVKTKTKMGEGRGIYNEHE